jgi:RimJ/RimL family protein N-acetyltransferase
MPAAVTLVPLDESHRAALEALVADPVTLRYTRIPEPPPPDFVDSWIARYAVGRAEGTSEAFAIVDGDDTFLGLALAPRIDRIAATAELGYVVAPEARGRGVASEALRLLTEWSFATHDLIRLELHISVENEASKAVARRAGYVREGVLRSVHVKAGLREDTELWSRLRDDP